MKSLTRRELLLEIFSRDTLKNVIGTYKQFNEAREEAGRISCDEAGRMLGKKAKKNHELNRKNL